MTPAQTWLLIALGIPTLMLLAWWITYWLEGRDQQPPPVDHVWRRCECGAYAFTHPSRTWYDAADGTVHRPDLCQPADEAL